MGSQFEWKSDSHKTFRNMSNKAAKRKARKLRAKERRKALKEQSEKVQAALEKTETGTKDQLTYAKEPLLEDLRVHMSEVFDKLSTKDTGDQSLKISDFTDALNLAKLKAQKSLKSTSKTTTDDINKSTN